MLFTYDSLLYPLMMRVRQLAAQIGRQLRALQMLVQIADARANHHAEFEFLAEQFRADLGDGLLEEARRSDDVDDVHSAREVVGDLD